MVPLSILALLLPAAFCLFEDTPYTTLVSDQKEIAKHIEDPDYFTIVVIFDKEGQNSIGFEALLTQAAETYKDFFRIVAYDCSENEKLCPEDVKASLPSVEGHQPAGLNPYTGKPLIHKRQFQGNVSQQTISKFILDNMPFLGETLKERNQEEFFEDSTLDKVILFSNKKKPPPLYKALVSKYRGYVQFGLVFDTEEELVKKYNVGTFPTFMGIKEDVVAIFDGKIEFDELAGFIEGYKGQFKKAPKQKKANKPKNTENQLNLPEYNELKLTADNFEKELEKEPKLTLIHFYKENKDDSWEEIHNTYKGIVLTGSMNCSREENEELAVSLGVKKFPAIRMFPGNRKKRSFNLVFDSHEDIVDEIQRELKSEIMSLAPQTLNNFIMQMQEAGRIGTIIFSDRDLPLALKAIAADPTVKETTTFGLFADREEEILSQFKTTKYPTMISFVAVNDEGGISFSEYQGELSNYAHMNQYFTGMASEFYQRKVKVSDEELEEEELEEFTNKTFQNKCVKKGGICAIVMLDGDIEDEANQAHMQTMKTIQVETTKKNIPITFGYIDGFCQYEFRDAFNIQETALPNIGIYVHAKNKAGVLLGKFAEDDIRSFIEKVIQGKVSTFEPPELSLVKRDCEAYRQSITATSDDEGSDEILQQILAEEAEKRKELGLDEESGSKKKKGKKKKGKKSKKSDL